MAYNKTTWHKGDVVSSSGLNNIEDELVELDSAKQDGGMGYYEEGHLVDQTIPVADWADFGVGYGAEVTLSEAPVIGQEHKLIVDGVEVTLTCYDDDGGWIICEDYDDPVSSFPIMTGTDTSGTIYIATAPTADVHVELIGPVLHKIGEEFINHGNFFVGATYDNGTFTLDKTYNQIMEAAKSGENIVIQCVTDNPDVFLFVGMYDLNGDYYVNTIYNNAGTPTVAQFTASDPDESPSFNGSL